MKPENEVTRKLADKYYERRFGIKIDWSTWPEDAPIICLPLPDGVKFEELKNDG